MIRTTKHKSPDSWGLRKYTKGTNWKRLLYLTALFIFGLSIIFMALGSQAASKEPEIQLAPKIAQVEEIEPEPIIAQEPPQTPPERKIEPLAKSYTEMETMIIEEMTSAGYAAPLFALKVAKCESGLNPNAVGDGGKSFGLWQWHLPSHPTMTKEQALDPIYSTQRAAQYFAAGKAHLWTCSRIIT
jgi:hypothetical protein